MAVCTDCEYCAPTVAYTTLEEMRICLSCLSPWAFWQWDHPSFNPTGEQRCNALVREHGNGRGLLGRADLRDALLRSEQIYQHQLGYPVVPTQIRETIKREPRQLNRYGDLAGYGYGRGNGGERCRRFTPRVRCGDHPNRRVYLPLAPPLQFTNRRKTPPTINSIRQTIV